MCRNFHTTQSPLNPLITATVAAAAAAALDL